MKTPIESKILNVTVPYKTIYHVDIQPKHSPRSRIQTTRVYETAVKTANFWDERMDTFLIEERPPKTALEVALWRFDYCIKALEEAK